MLFRIFSALMVLSLCSCSLLSPRPAPEKSALLSPSSSLLIVVPRDAEKGNHTYPDSGRLVAQKLVQAFTGRVARVRYTEVAVKGGGFTHIIQPAILRWSDHTSSWVKTPDEVSLGLTLMQFPSGQALDTTTVSAKSSWTDFGGHQPEQLLDRVCEDYARRVSQR